MTISLSKRDRVVILGSLLAALVGAALINCLGVFKGLPLGFDAVFDVVVFLAVGFLPGFLLISLLGFDDFSLGERFIFSVAISLTLDSLVGICLSGVYALFPQYPLLRNNALFISFLLINLVLFLLYIVKSREDTETITLNRRTALGISLAMILIAGSVIGAFVVNTYSSPDVIIGLLLVIILFVLFQSLVPLHQETNALIIWGLALAVIFHRDLITSYIIGVDVQMTHYLASQIASLGYWSSAMGYNAPAVNIVIPPAIYKEMIGINIYNVEKYFYAFLFSLVPVGIYYAFKDEGPQRAFWSAVVFTFYYEFFAWTPGKQEIAELFLILIVLLVRRYSQYRHNRLGFMALVLIFLASIAMTHEGIAWILFFVLLPVWVASNVFKTENQFLGSRYIFYFVVVLAWFMNLSNGIVFNSIVFTIKQVIDSLSGMFVTVQQRTAVSTVRYLPPSILWKINAYLYYALTLLLVIGVLALVLAILKKVIFEKKRLADDSPYLFISFFAFLMSGFFITGNFGTDRAYQIALLVLSPFVVDGYNILVSVPGRLSNIMKVITDRFGYIGFSLFLAVYFLFNTGLVYYFLDQPVASAISLTPNANSEAYNTAELTGAIWMKNEGSSDKMIYADSYSLGMLYSVLPGGFDGLSLPITGNEQISYIFLRERAVVQEIIGIDYAYVQTDQLTNLSSVKPEIYSNGYATVFD